MYRNGRWRSHYAINGNSVKGTLKAQVHYYEDGNVQLQTEKAVEFNGSTPAEIIKQVLKAEAEYQSAVNESYAQVHSNASLVVVLSFFFFILFRN